jgi:hypothetical protein
MYIFIYMSAYICIQIYNTHPELTHGIAWETWNTKKKKKKHLIVLCDFFVQYSPNKIYFKPQMSYWKFSEHSITLSGKCFCFHRSVSTESHLIQLPLFSSQLLWLVFFKVCLQCYTFPEVFFRVIIDTKTHLNHLAYYFLLWPSSSLANA